MQSKSVQQDIVFSEAESSASLFLSLCYDKYDKSGGYMYVNTS